MVPLDTAVIEIARDAIREGRIAEIAGIVGDQPKGLLLGELTVALGQLAVALGLNCLTINVHRNAADATINTGNSPDSVDRFVEDIVASGGSVTVAANDVEDWESMWRVADVRIGGLRIRLHGGHRKKAGAA